MISTFYNVRIEKVKLESNLVDDAPWLAQTADFLLSPTRYLFSGKVLHTPGIKPTPEYTKADEGTIKTIVCIALFVFGALLATPMKAFALIISSDYRNAFFSTASLSDLQLAELDGTIDLPQPEVGETFEILKEEIGRKCDYMDKLTWINEFIQLYNQSSGQQEVLKNALSSELNIRKDKWINALTAIGHSLDDSSTSEQIAEKITSIEGPINLINFMTDTMNLMHKFYVRFFVELENDYDDVPNRADAMCNQETDFSFTDHIMGVYRAMRYRNSRLVWNDCFCTKYDQTPDATPYFTEGTPQYQWRQLYNSICNMCIDAGLIDALGKKDKRIQNVYQPDITH